MSRENNSVVKNWRNLPMSNPKPDFYNTNAYIKFGENPLRFTQVIVLELKYGCGQIILSTIDEICPLAISKQISTISTDIPSLVKRHWYLLKLLSGNENTDVLRADNFVKIEICPLAIPNQISTNIYVYTKFGENPLTFTQVIVRKRKYERKDDRRTVRRMDRRTTNKIP